MNSLTPSVLPESLADRLANPVVPTPAAAKPPTAYQHFVAMLHELRDADIETLMLAETDFFNFIKPDMGDSQTWAQDIAELCNQLIDRRYAEHYEGLQHDPFVNAYGDWRK